MLINNIIIKDFEGYYNVGPDDRDCSETGRLVDLFVSKWGDGIKWINQYDGGPHEANFLKLDCSKLKKVFWLGTKMGFRSSNRKSCGME